MNDNTKLLITSGSGGDGAISGIRKKFIPRGGPDGGDGGEGGSIVVFGNKKLSSLKDVTYIKKIKAQNGFPGSAGNKKGKKGKDKVINLPIGTVIYEVQKEVRKKLYEVLKEEKKTILPGGKGGRCNSKMANSVIQYPLLAEKGEDNKEILIELDYLMESDVAIIGKPNSGKSSLLSKLTNAKPQIKNYPYTTTNIETGIIENVKRQHKVIEIPGIEDSNNNLGLKNLKHTERTKLFLFLKSSQDDKTLEIIKKHKKNILKNKAVITIPSYLNLEEKELDFKNEDIEEIKIRVEELLGKTKQNNLSQNEVPEVIVIGEEKEVVEKRGQKFIVNHEQVKRIAERVNLDHWDVMAQFMKILHNKGVSKKLFELEVKPGDIVEIGKIELEWS